MSPKTQDNDIIQFEEKLSNALILWGIARLLSVFFIMTGTNILARIIDTFLRIFMVEWFWWEGEIVVTICIVVGVLTILATSIYGIFYFRLIKIISNEPGTISEKNHNILILLSKIHFIGQIIINSLSLILSIILAIIKASSSSEFYSDDFEYGFLTSTFIFEIVLLILGLVYVIIWIIFNFYFKLWLTGIYNGRKRTSKKEFFVNLQIMMLIGAVLSIVSIFSNSLIYFIAIMLMGFYLKPRSGKSEGKSNEKTREEKDTKSREEEIAPVMLKFCYNCGEKLDESVKTDKSTCPKCKSPL